MTGVIKSINLGGVNCYLLSNGDSLVLIDTGFSNKRSQLVKELGNTGCRPDNLKLIVLTHGDIDHAANAAYLRQNFLARIAMHQDDAGMVEQGNMGWNRKARPDKISLIGSLIILLGSVSTIFSPANKFEKFRADMLLEDGQPLSDVGLDASVVHLPGHSKGSIGILTASRDLFCGDLLWNMRKPGPHFLVDDLAAYTSSLEKLKSLNVKTVYPGHGSPFPLEKLFNG
jgi:glyoxylase-like metal-dependent hydrolase (beta-lactamase superfamily II)